MKWFRTQQYYDSGAWRGTWKFDGGGALMNQAIHSVDLLTWIMGPVVEISAVTATLAHERIEVEDVAMATLKQQVQDQELTKVANKNGTDLGWQC